MNVLIKSATIVDPGNELHGKRRDIWIRNGIIEKIAASLSVEESDTRLVKRKNLHVSRGWFDCSVSFGEPGYEERETLDNGLKVAAASGYTDLILNPSNHPVPDTSGDIRFLIDKTAHSACSLYPLGSITRESRGESLSDLFDMHRHGAIGFSDDQRGLENGHILQLALAYSTLFDGCIITFPFDRHLAGKGVVHEGIAAVHLGLKGIPALAEEVALLRDLKIQEYSGGKMHIALVSAEESVKLLAEAKRKGRNVSSAVSVNHLYFTDEDLSNFDSNLKVLPPIRGRRDRKALREALISGTIDMVTTDHRPLTREEKEVEFDLAHYGATGLETAFGALLSMFDLDQAIGLLTRGRSHFNIPDYPLEVGKEARITFFDPDHAYRCEPGWFMGRSRNSPFMGKDLRGMALGIFANNRLFLRTEDNKR